MNEHEYDMRVAESGEAGSEADEPTVRSSGRGPRWPRTEAQAEASRRNGRKSRGPRTEEGRACSNMGPVTHGTFRTRITPIRSGPLADDPEEMQRYVDAGLEFAPRGSAFAEIAEHAGRLLHQQHRLFDWVAMALEHDIEKAGRGVLPHQSQYTEAVAAWTDHEADLLEGVFERGLNHDQLAGIVVTLNSHPSAPGSGLDLEEASHEEVVERYNSIVGTIGGVEGAVEWLRQRADRLRADARTMEKERAPEAAAHVLQSDAIDKYARAEAHIDRRLRTAFKNLIELKKAGLLEGRSPDRDDDFAEEDGHEDDLREQDDLQLEEEDDMEEEEELEEEDELLEAELLETAHFAEEPEQHEMSDSTRARTLRDWRNSFPSRRDT
jgi:hypothetical protein